MTKPALKPPLSPMTTADFLDWSSGEANQSYQLVDGEPRAMAPASATHGILQATVAYLIKLSDDF